MTKFRPCIDLHQGKVKQIVGGSLNNDGAKENFISAYDAVYYAKLYQEHELTGGHVIALGAGNKIETIKALQAYPNGLQFGGGITHENASDYLEAGASKLIVTSYLFEQGEFSLTRLEKMKSEIGQDNLVLDLSCRKTNNGWYIATDRWQTITSMQVNKENLIELASHCSEFLIHAADVEGLQAGIDQELVSLLGQNGAIPITYAGGARSIDDLKLVNSLSNGKVDLTIGSALDYFSVVRALLLAEMYQLE